jgi:hypothetical protein
MGLKCFPYVGEFTKRVITCCGVLLSTTTHVLGCSGYLGSIRISLNDSFGVFNCLYTFQTFGNIKWIGLSLVLWIELKLFEKCSRDELSEILELIGIGLWRVYLYAIVIICDMWICFVEVFEHVCIVYGELLRKWWRLWK